MVTQNSSNQKTGASGKVMQGQGAGTAPDFSTATYPATSGSSGVILRADGTNYVTTTATYPSTTTINRILYSSAANTVSQIATANNGVMVADNSGVPSMLAAGTLNYALTANTSAPPSWQKQRGYCFNIMTTQGNPADSTTYYMTINQNFTAQTVRVASNIFFCPVAGTIKRVYGVVTNQGTLGTAENCTVNIRKNDTTNTAVTTTLATNTTENTFNNTGLSISMSAGDYFSVTFVAPAWATNPTLLRMACSVYVE